MVVQYNNKTYLFVHIGGNAGTSIEWYLHTLNNPSYYHPYKYKKGNFKHIDIIRNKDFQQAVKGKQHNKLADYIEQDIKFDYSFAVIRNPYDRVLAKFFTSPQSKNITSENARQLFADFVNEIYSVKTKFAREQAIHTCCQSNYILYGNISINSILRFENLQGDFNSFCNYSRLPQKQLIKCNSTSHPLKSINLYNEKSVMMVYANNKYIIDNFYN